MKNMLYALSLFFLLMPQLGSAQKQMFPLAYILLLKDMLVQSSSPTHRAESEDNEFDKSYGEEFLSMFQDSLQDGFFGGVKWGIAACFYQVLYELSSGVVSVIPESVRFVKQLCAHFFDAVCGRSPAIDVQALSILAQLFHDTMQEYNTPTVHMPDHHYIAFRNSMVKEVCDYLLSYLRYHKKHYINSAGEWTCIVHVADMISSDRKQNVAFVIALLERNITCILECIQSPATYEDVLPVTRTTLHAFQTLGFLLKSTVSDSEHEGVFGAWFSKSEQAKEIKSEV